MKIPPFLSGKIYSKAWQSRQPTAWSVAALGVIQNIKGVSLKKIITYTLLLFVAGCASKTANKNIEIANLPKQADVDGTMVYYTGGSGSSCDNPVYISGTKDRVTGVKSQYVWLNSVYPGAKLISRGSSGTEDGEHAYSMFSLEVANKGRVKVCFEITEYFFESVL